MAAYAWEAAIILARQNWQIVVIFDFEVRTAPSVMAIPTTETPGNGGSGPLTGTWPIDCPLISSQVSVNTID
jgi:hypothetical protein